MKKKKKKTRRRALEPTCQGDASETAFRDATGRLADWSARRFYEVVNKLFVASAVAVAVVVFSLQSCCNVHSERPAPVAAVKICFGKVSFHKKLPFTLRSAKRSFPRVDELYFNPKLLWPTRTVNNIIGTIAHSNSRAIEREREKHLRTDQRFCSPSSFSSSLYKTKSKKNFESVILWGSDLPTLDIGSWGTRIRASFY